MIDTHFALKFAEAWIASWNSHNMESVLSHYTDDFVFESPVAARIVPESGGMLSGKPAIKAYWEKALAQIPDLHFEIHEVLVGVNSVTLYYTNRATGKKSAEVMFLNEEGKVYKGFAHYSQ
jgi:ketosteroid isomerase-like protein